jgi:ABC-type branched-subunit amino acid transport system substrate-binding protein
MSRYTYDRQIKELTERLWDGDVSRRDFLRLASGMIGATAASALLAACGQPTAAPSAATAAPSADRVRLGMMTTLSGIGSIHAPPTINAATLAVDEINAAGGLLGKQVDLIIEDNHTDVDIAVQKGLKLVQDKKVAAFVDFGFSNSRFAVAEKVALAHKTIMLSPIFYEGGICNRYFFNISALPNQGIDPFVPWLMKERGAKTFYGIGSAYAWGIGSIDAVQKAVTANGAEFKGREEAPLGTTDWSAIIQRLSAAAPDVCFVFVAGNDLVTFLKQFFDFGLNGKVQLAFTYFQEEVTPTIAEEFRAGHLSTNTWFLTYDSPESKKFLEGYYRVAGQGTLVTMFGEATYDAIWIWANAVKKAGTFETEAVVEALKGLSFKAPQGEIVIDPKTHHATVRCLIAESTRDPNNFKILADLGMIPPVPPKECNADSIR